MVRKIKGETTPNYTRAVENEVVQCGLLPTYAQRFTRQSLGDWLDVAQTAARALPHKT